MRGLTYDPMDANTPRSWQYGRQRQRHQHHPPAQVQPGGIGGAVGGLGMGELPALPISGNPQAVVDHPAMGRVQYRVDEVSDDPDTQTAQVIGMMRGYVLADYRSPQIQQEAQAHTYSADAIGDVYAHVTGRMRFVRDEVTAEPLQAHFDQPIVEALIRPRDMAVLPSGSGDCDDYAMYGAALLLARGVPVSFVTVAADDRDPNAFSHVYLAAYPKDGPYAGQRVAVDLSHGPYPGWEVANRLGKRAEWSITSGITAVLVMAALAAGLWAATHGGGGGGQ